MERLHVYVVPRVRLETYDKHIQAYTHTTVPRLLYTGQLNLSKKHSGIAGIVSSLNRLIQTQ